MKGAPPKPPKSIGPATGVVRTKKRSSHRGAFRGGPLNEEFPSTRGFPPEGFFEDGFLKRSGYGLLRRIR